MGIRFSRWVKDVVTRRTTLLDTDLFALVTDTPLGAAITAADVRAQIGGIQSDGSVLQAIRLTQAEYNALPTPRPATTIYYIVG